MGPRAAPTGLGEKGQKAQKRTNPRFVRSAGSAKESRRCSTLPRGLPRSTIDAGGLDYRVRDGIGYGPSAMVTRTKGRLRFCLQHSLSKLSLGMHVRESRGQCCGHDGYLVVNKTRSGRPISTARLSPAAYQPCSLQGVLDPKIELPSLEAGFPLRCFQRLSLPHIATLRCHWRDNRYTRGASNPVLSY
jgi:hypothetical protein